jgi:hypothetical protein
MSETISTDSASHQRNASRIKRDEEELQALLKDAGITQDETEKEEEAVIEEPSSPEPVEPPVQAESSPEQKEEPKAEAQEEIELSAEEKTFKQRYSDIRKHMQEKDKEFKSKLEKLENQLKSAANNELVLPKSPDEVEAWAKKFPDVAGIVEAIADKKASERADELDGRLKEIEALRATAKREKAEAEILSLHPDFEELRAGEDFHTWAKKQPKVVQDALYENSEDAQSVARVIDLYKSDKGITAKPKKNTDKAAASSVKAKGRPALDADDSTRYLRESQVHNMSIKEYEKRMDEIKEAQRSGKFIYDMSKK